MAVKDYAPLLLLSKNLVQKFGRAITLRKLDAVSATGGKPWLGATDPVATGTSTSTYAIGCHPDSTYFLGISLATEDLLKTTELIFITSPGDIDPENLDKYTTVVDGSEEYKITFIEKLKPATITILYYIGVSK
jgi:hypothetical protein